MSRRWIYGHYAAELFHLSHAEATLPEVTVHCIENKRPNRFTGTRIGFGATPLATLARSWAAALVLLCGLALAPSARGAPAEVTIGMHVNDVTQVDLRHHHFVIDLYVWFRWDDPELDPGRTFEVMNPGDPEFQLLRSIYVDSTGQPDGRRYELFRYQGEIADKFPVRKYPFDHQVLRLWIEDQASEVDRLVYVVDEVTMRDDIVLPGYDIGEVSLKVVDEPYPTRFGDLRETEAGTFSRAVLAIDIDRPWLAGAVKTFLPVLLIILCGAATFLIDPPYVDARIGLAITSLLALVAHQYSVLATLPEVGYLLLLDQIYIVSYLFNVVCIGVIVHDKRQADVARSEEVAPAPWGVRRALVAVGAYTVVVTVIVVVNLTVWS